MKAATGYDMTGTLRAKEMDCKSKGKVGRNQETKYMQMKGKISGSQRGLPELLHLWPSFWRNTKMLLLVVP